MNAIVSGTGSGSGNEVVSAISSGAGRAGIAAVSSSTISSSIATVVVPPAGVESDCAPGPSACGRPSCEKTSETVGTRSIRPAAQFQPAALGPFQRPDRRAAHRGAPARPTAAPAARRQVKTLQQVKSFGQATALRRGKIPQRALRPPVLRPVATAAGLAAGSVTADDGRHHPFGPGVEIVQQRARVAVGQQRHSDVRDDLASSRRVRRAAARSLRAGAWQPSCAAARPAFVSASERGSAAGDCAVTRLSMGSLDMRNPL